MESYSRLFLFYFDRGVLQNPNSSTYSLGFDHQEVRPSTQDKFIHIFFSSRFLAFLRMTFRSLVGFLKACLKLFHIGM